MRRLLAAGLILVGSICAALAQQPSTSNLVSGSVSATTTGAATIIAAPATRVIYVTAIQCGRSETGTSAIRVTFNDVASTVMVLPNSGGGGGNNMTFPSPLMVPASAALTFVMSTNTSTVYCNAQGFTGN